MSAAPLISGLLVALTLAAPVVAQEAAPGTGRNRLRVPFPIPATTASITLDGAVTEDLWTQALALELKYEVRPGENIPPPVRTEMLLAHSGSHLFVAFKCHDDRPAAIRARFSDRDSMFDDDYVGIVLDTFNDERRAYEFFSNPLGVQGDMLMDDVTGNEDASWNAIFDSAGRLTETGYEVEFAIPLSQLRFQATQGAQTWGLDGIRSYPRADRHHITLFPRVRGENSYLGQEEKISGFAGVRPGQNLELIPTLTAVRSDTRADFPFGNLVKERGDGDFGVTVKWGVTPNITVNGTINPDFSQIEADSVQLDVNNQFSLFFGETRPFFLEGSDFFRTTRLNLLHTRQVAQPSGAVKVSGKAGRQAFGFFAAQDEASTLILPGVQRSQTLPLDAETMTTVGRYRFDVGDTSAIGAMVTDRRGGGYFNNIVAFDGRHRIGTSDSVSATLAISNTLDRPAIVAATGSQARRTGHAFDVYYNHSARSWNAFATYGDLSGDFRADLGFITRVGTRRGEFGGSRTWHGDSTRFYNQIRVSANFDQTEQVDRTLVEREVEGYVSFNGRRESYLETGAGVRTFVFSGVSFDQRFWSAYGEMRPAGSVVFSVSGNWGDWIDFEHVRPADQRGLRASATVNLGRHLSARLNHRYEILDVDGGRLFSAHVPELRLSYQHDARTLVRVILQYTHLTRDPSLFVREIGRESRDLFMQLLASHKINAQTALYFGYVTGASGTDQFALTNANRTFFGKVSYAWLR